MEKDFTPLTREEVINVIEGKGQARRIPTFYHCWVNPGVFGSRYEEAKALLDKYPCDFELISIAMPDKYNAPDDDKSYRFMHRDPDENESTNKALDAQASLRMEEIDDMIADFPNPDYPRNWQYQFGEKKKYRVLNWWYWLFERHWYLRGMENALTDFYEYPEETHKLYNALTDFYIGIVRNAKKYYDIDGVFISDDIGTQKATFFSTDIFNEFFRPYYQRMVDACHEIGCHFWLHTCGNVFDFVPSFIDMGMDVLHPIQKYAMNEEIAAKEFGDKITIFAGLDVQSIIPFGTPEEVRKEVRHIIDTYRREDGRFILTLGNGATPDISVENLEAFLDESLVYGQN